MGAKTDLPVYYDSEPSSQPPRYADKLSTQTQFASPADAKVKRIHQMSEPQHHEIVSAATVSAVLASPYDDLDAQRRAHRKRRTLRERWRDFRERNFFVEMRKDEAYGSAAEWNVQGARIAGGQATPCRHQRAERK